MTASPELLSELSTRFTDPIDVFVCGASFEDRCLSISNELPEELVRSVVVVYNETYDSEVSGNRGRLKGKWGKKCEILTVSSDDPLLSFDNLFRRLKLDVETPQHVLIDITTVTHETVMMLYQIASLCFQKTDTVEFIYATADDYSMGQDKPQKWLSKGINEIRSVVGYPGRIVPSKSNHLIVLLGFEEYRALSIIRELEPSLISIGYGDSEDESTGPHQETNEKKVQRLRSLVGDVNKFVFSCYDPLSAEATLADLVAKNSNLNPKLSTLGAAQVATKNDDIQLCYAQPTNYNSKEYSKPGTQYYIFRFHDLGIKRAIT